MRILGVSASTDNDRLQKAGLSFVGEGKSAAVAECIIDKKYR